MWKGIMCFALLYVNNYIWLGECKKGKMWDVGRRVRRQVAYQMCSDTFDIYQDKIIRTEDSRELGAKYITERDVATREDCYQLCCDTTNCDVFVFEEKRPGSCYLFECGPPDDFKCKFTKHRNYTSGVNKHLSELETQIKFTKHEHELTNLREPEKSGVRRVQEADVKTTTASPLGNKETLQLLPQQPKHAEKVVEKCSRFYQFECRTSHECIAIYNACDGIPQCSDGSDEAPELECPKQGSDSAGTKEPSKAPSATAGPQVDKPKGAEPAIKNTLSEDRKSEPEKVASQQQYSAHQSGTVDKGNESEGDVNSYRDWKGDRQGASVNSRFHYGREGEGLQYPRVNPDAPWYNDRTSYGHNPTGGAGEIFNHKGKSVVPQSERYPPQRNGPFPENAPGNVGAYPVPAAEEQLSNEYARYNYYEAAQRRGGQPIQYAQPSHMGQPAHFVQAEHYAQTSWQATPKTAGDEGTVKNDRYPGEGGIPQEFYYDENAYRSRQHTPSDTRGSVLSADDRILTRLQPPSPPRASAPNLPPHLTYENRAHMELTSLAKSTKQEESKVVPGPSGTSVTPVVAAAQRPIHVQEEHRHQLTHIKFEKLSADAAFAPSETDGHNTSPNGAILSLTFGLLITALMVAMVGCRIRTVRRRLRRGGKSLAHDADFLVNGMYL